MKALTVRQPYASLIAAGVKRIETRSWSTSFRGPLAIHAGTAKAGMALIDAGRCCREDDAAIVTALSTHGFGAWSDLPLGAVVATATLVDVIRIDPSVIWQGTPQRIDGEPLPPENHGWLRPGPPWRWIYIADDADRPNLFINEDQRPFGDFTRGRYAWLLDDIQPLDVPVPAKGRQGLWDWNEADR